ncbi:hypothetical protein [Pectinatus frisingensis]|uniref:hypothetical protein n=1 Tax=Pectinatus frisingensis TaxID=865 RepID=UPI0018C4BE9B|nr:hypothetical protein [Pectinatus frisingensis]
MTKRIMIFTLVLCVLFSTIVLAQAETEDTQDNWVPIELGKGNDDVFYFDKTSLHYDVDKNGKVNKNIINYREKKVNRNSATLDEGFYSITDCKIDLVNQALLLGKQTFYKSNGEKRWSETPTYLVWYSVQPGTMGGTRYAAVAAYAADHSDQIK